MALCVAKEIGACFAYGPCVLALIVLPVLYSVWIRKAPASLALEDDVAPAALIE